MRTRYRLSIVLGCCFAISAAVAAPAQARRSSSFAGYDISYPQCGGSFPRSPGFGIVGVNNGRPFNDNPCLAAEYAWAAAAPKPPAFYMNIANPGSISVHWTEPGPRSCSGPSDDLGCAYNYGWNAAAHATGYARAQTGTASGAWWIDVETANSWSSENLDANATVVRGAVDYLAGSAGAAGVYSTAYQWNIITGSPAGFDSVPNWLAGASSAKDATRRCSTTYSFTGGAVVLVQYPSGGFDADTAC